MSGRFKPGQSGNPAGRPRGIPSPSAKLRQAIGEHSDEIIKVMVQQALAGDVSAASLLLSRVLPTARPESLTATIANTGTTMAERAESITAATLAGEIPGTTASDLMAILAGQARIKEIDEIERRLVVVEARMK